MKYSIIATVGNSGKNLNKDVRLIQALLCVWLRKNNKDPIDIDGGCGTQTKDTIKEFQKDVVKLNKPGTKIDPGGKTFNALIKCLKDVIGKPQALIYPKEGRFTFEVEGHEGGIYHSRILHVPNANSGLTLGRGFDMKQRSKPQIYSYLVKSGVSVKNAQKISKASGLKGQNAKMFIVNNDLLDFQICPRQQKNLFILCYEKKLSKTKKISTQKPDTIKEYGKCDWDKLDSRIKEVTVDLTFRGDYKGSTRKHIQKSIVDNDLASFKKAISNRSFWSNVPMDRFNKRIAHLN